MNTKTIYTVGVVLICAVPQLFAEDANPDQPIRDSAQPHVVQRLTHSGSAAKTSQILGREIRDVNDRKIGKVRDVALDLQNGRIVAVIVGTGGFLGIDEKDIALPSEEFTWDPDAKKLVSQLDQEQLRNAPVFDTAHWPVSVSPASVREIYHRYNVSPYFIDESVPQKAATETKPAFQLTSAGMANPVLHLGFVEHARTVIGASVQNPQDERVGKVENVILDLANGRVVVMIVSTGDFLRMGNEVSAIPSQAFHYEEDRNVFVLSTTREALRTAPHFKPDQWPAIASPDRVAMVYDAYNVSPYQPGIDADNTAQNVRDRSSGAVTPFDQGTSSSDRAITARIRRAIMSRSDLSIDAQNVKIITINGQVTLRGPVKNMEEERAIIEIARNAVTQNTKVTNQIQTISEPLKPQNNPAPTPPDSN